MLPVFDAGLTASAASKAAMYMPNWPKLVRIRQIQFFFFWNHHVTFFITSLFT
jgi:hypothetical protein